MSLPSHTTSEQRDGASRIGDRNFPTTVSPLFSKRRVPNEVRRRLRDKVVLLYVGDNVKALEIAEGLAVRGCDLVLICDDTVAEEAMWLEDTVTALGQRCMVIVQETLTISFYRRVMEQVYFTFGYLDLFVDYGGNNAQPPASSGYQPSAVLLWLYFQLKRPTL